MSGITRWEESNGTLYLHLSSIGNMPAELEETVPSTDEEDEDEATDDKSRKKKASASGSKKKNKKNQPGKYSQLVVDTIRKLGERNGSSLAKIYSEAKQVAWFDQQNGRTYLKYSVKALVQNATLLQVKGVGANGSFRINKRKLDGGDPEKKPAPFLKKAAAKESPKKAKAKPEPKKEQPKAAPKKKKEAAASGDGKKVKKTDKPKGHKAGKA